MDISASLSLRANGPAHDIGQTAPDFSPDNRALAEVLWRLLDNSSGFPPPAQRELETGDNRAPFSDIH